MNSLDIAGVTAISRGLKANHVMRCLDVNILPGDEEFARSVFYLFFFFFFFLGKGLALTWGNVLQGNIELLYEERCEETEQLSKAYEGSSVQSRRGLRKAMWGRLKTTSLPSRFGRAKRKEYVPMSVSISSR